MTETTYTAPRLERPRHSRLGGVCPALARATGTDVLLWRVLFVVLIFFHGIGIVLYLVAWVTIPAAGEQQSIAERVIFGPDRRLGTRNLVLLAVTVAVIVGAVRDGTELVALAVLAGLALLWSRRHHGDHQPIAPVAPAVVAEAAPTTADAPASTVTAVVQEAEFERPSGPSITGLALSIAALVVGVLLAFSAAGTTGITADIVIASALGVVGIALVVSSVWGRSRGLVPIALVLALGLAVTEGARPALDHGVGNRNWNVVGTTDASYRLGIGNANLYLGATYPATGSEHVKARVDLGQLQVHVPFGVRALVIAHVHLGAIKGGGDLNGPSTETNGRDITKSFVLGPAGPPKSSSTPTSAPDRWRCGMTEPGTSGRHKLQVTPLVVGLVSIAGAVLALLSRAGADIDALVVLATLWVVVGVVGATRGVYRLVVSSRSSSELTTE